MATTQELIAELATIMGSLETERATVEGLKAETVSHSQVIASLIVSGNTVMAGLHAIVEPQA